MPKAAELKRGMIVEIDGAPHIVADVDVKSPSSRSGTTLYKIRFRNLQTKQKRDESLKGDDLFNPIDFERREVQFSYRDGNQYVFMDQEDFSQHLLDEDALGESTGFLLEGMGGILALLVDGQIVGIELPASVALEIVETAPALKAASATSRTKTARLATGIEIQVPEYLEAGEVVKVNTETGRFVSRA